VIAGLAAGRVHGLLVFAIAFIALWLKLHIKESWIEREFGER
jgi:hypothetical protein